MRLAQHGVQKKVVQAMLRYKDEKYGWYIPGSGSCRDAPAWQVVLDVTGRFSGTAAPWPVKRQSALPND